MTLQTPAYNPKQDLVLANSHRVAGRIAEAKLILRRILEILPNFHPAYHLLGLVAFRDGNLPQAIKLVAKAVTLDGSVAQYHQSIGELFIHSGQLDIAVKALRRSLTIKPDQPRVLFTLAGILRDQKDLPAALVCYNQLIARYPDKAQAYFQRAWVLDKLKHFSHALTDIDRALALELKTPEIHNKRANILIALGRYDEALASYDRALALKPDYLESIVNRGFLLQHMHHYNAALDCYDHAIKLQPDFAPAYLHKALLLLALGDQQQGWKMYEWRWKVSDKSRDGKYYEPLWLGKQAIDGKTLLIWGEAGFGDILQFCRFIPLLKATHAHVVLEASAPLVPLLKTLSGGELQVVECGQPLPSYDLQCPMMSLPLACGTTLATLPNTVPYLRADVARREAWQQRLGKQDRPRIGIVWSGRAGAGIDYNPCRCRSLPLTLLEPLLQLPLEFHCLQKELHAHDATALTDFPQLHLHHTDLHDFAETAALIEAMDLVVTIDTSIAHLAGALGKPLWVLLPFSTDFRWTLNQDTTPWYPTATLFRQIKAGDWSTVVVEVLRRLQILAEDNQRGQNELT